MLTVEPGGDITERFSDLNFLAIEYVPPSSYERFVWLLHARLFSWLRPEVSEVFKYEAALRSNVEELLARSDTMPVVRRYIERHINGSGDHELDGELRNWDDSVRPLSNDKVDWDDAATLID